jgi:hypothetical protein
VVGAKVGPVFVLGVARENGEFFLLLDCLPKGACYASAGPVDSRSGQHNGAGQSQRYERNSPFELLILPKILKSFGRQLSVSNGVLDIFVPEVMLERPGVLTIVGELEPASMAKHVRMNWERHLGGFL